LHRGFKSATALPAWGASPLPENNDGGRRGFGKGRDDEPNFELFEI
jgi:hypothetical protein